MSEETTNLEIANLKKSVEGLKHTVYGNGSMGLRTKVMLLMWGLIPVSMTVGAMLKEFLEKVVG